MAREDQLERMVELGITPSFFVAHVFYWGDRHRDIFMGPERAARISPLRSSLRRGIRFTTHNDTPVTAVENRTGAASTRIALPMMSRTSTSAGSFISASPTYLSSVSHGGTTFRLGMPPRLFPPTARNTEQDGGSCNSGLVSACFRMSF